MSVTHPLEILSKRIERAFEAVENPAFIPVLKDNPKYSDMQVEETGDGFRIKIDLNDINPDEVQLGWSYGLLTVSTVEMSETEERSEAEDFQITTDEANTDPERIEAYVPFNYQITMPGNVDPAVITVEFVEDTLEIQFTKAKAPSVALAS